MSLLPPFPSGKIRPPTRRKGGFTLVEILVAVTILAIIILFFGQMVVMMNKVWLYGHGRANNFTKARAMMELLAQDIQSGVFRPDLAAFPNSQTTASPPIWEFYTARPGIPSSSASAGSVRNLSTVQYSFIGPTNPNNGIPNTLERGDSPVLWSDAPATSLNFGSTTTFGSGTIMQRDTASGVVAFQVVFIQADGTFSTTYTPLSSGGVVSTNPTRAVSLTLAVIDDLTVSKLSSAQLTALNGLLTNAVTDNPPKHSIKSYWDTYLNSTSMNWSAYPKGLGSGLATFERYVILPNAP